MMKGGLSGTERNATRSIKEKLGMEQRERGGGGDGPRNEMRRDESRRRESWNSSIRQERDGAVLDEVRCPPELQRSSRQTQIEVTSVRRAVDIAFSSALPTIRLAADGCLKAIG